MAARGKSQVPQPVADQLSRADAAVWLLKDLQAGELAAVLQGNTDRREWLAGMATDALADALAGIRLAVGAK